LTRCLSDIASAVASAAAAAGSAVAVSSLARTAQHYNADNLS